MAKNKNRTLHPDEPLLHPDHARPVTRRDFIRQGFISGAGTVLAPSIFGLLGSNPAHALSSDLEALKLPVDCDIATAGGGKIPFICFDLAGGANFAGSNVLVGGPGGAQDLLTSAGYSKMGVPGDRLPNFSDLDPVTGFVNKSLGLPFHNESSMLAGILENFTTPTNINGAIIPARSDNDTGNNPHNPMYGIHQAGASGELMALIGSRNSVSGGNSMSPAAMIDLTVRPTKIDRQSDVKGLVDTGELVNKMGKENATRVMEAIQRISAAKMGKVNIDPSATPEVDEVGITKKVNCGYVQSADLVERYGDPAALDVDADTDIDAAFGGAGNYLIDGEFRKTASVMKMVVNGYAGAGTITMGGYDYHTGNRTTGDARDLRA
ncbi:MAG: general secretion pathway protein GspF, partial [Gammaproteobacteria bacterium]|nr:general secretion pathway protein GspF [Gammaproteobacteria bacterium]